jgi:DUF971 family protein
MNDNDSNVSRRDVLRTGTTAGVLLFGTGTALSGTAAASGSTSFEFSDDCHKVEVTNKGYSGRYTLEILLANGNRTTRSKQAPAGKSRRFNFARSIVRARVTDRHGNVLGTATCPSSHFEFSDDCREVTVRNRNYSGEYVLRVEFTDGTDTTRTRNAPAGKPRTVDFDRTIRKARVEIHGVVTGSARCKVREKRSAHFEFSDDCREVTVRNRNYSGEYVLEVKFTDGTDTTRTRTAPEGKPRTVDFDRTIRKAIVRVDGHVIGSAKCEVEKEPSAHFEFSDDCREVTVRNRNYSGEYVLEAEFTDGTDTTRTRNAPAGKPRTVDFDRTIRKAIVRVDGHIIGSAKCEVKEKRSAHFEFSDDCHEVTVRNRNYSGEYVLEVEFTDGTDTTRTRTAPEGKPRTVDFDRTIRKAIVRVDGHVIGSARCKVKEKPKPKADVKLVGRCRGLAVKFDDYSGPYRLRLKFQNGETGSESGHASAGVPDSYVFRRPLRRVRVKVDGDVVGRARCDEDYDLDKDWDWDDEWEDDWDWDDH